MMYPLCTLITVYFSEIPSVFSETELKRLEQLLQATKEKEDERKKKERAEKLELQKQLDKLQQEKEEEEKKQRENEKKFGT